MRETCMLGSVRGAPSNGRPYRDCRPSFDSAPATSTQKNQPRKGWFLCPLRADIVQKSFHINYLWTSWGGAYANLVVRRDAVTSFSFRMIVQLLLQ